MQPRLMLIALVVALPALFPSAARAAADFGRYHALVIGINDYRHLDRLKSAVNDASAVHDLLSRQYGFESTLLLNPSRRDIVTALDRLVSALTVRDNLLIFYAGHGILEPATQRGFWLPVDAEEESRADWVSTATISDTLKAVLAKHVLVIADSCYSGALTRSARIELKVSGGRTAELQRLSDKRARKALTSGGLEPVLDGGGDGHSVFTRALLQALRDNREVIDGHQLYRTIRQAVARTSPQTPAYSDVREAGDEGGDFLFVPSRRTPVASAVTGDATAAAPTASRPNREDLDKLFWESIKDGNARADFEAYLQRFPDGIFAAIARNRLSRMDAVPTTNRPAPARPATPSQRIDLAELEPVEDTFVATRNANVRAAPTTAAARIATVPAGKEVYVAGVTDNGDWFAVELDDGRTGFIFATLLAPPGGDWETAMRGGSSGNLADASSSITVNGQALPQQARQYLSQLYGPLQPGNYWYDPVSGLWGLWGGPSIGQIQPGLDLGGHVPAHASGGGTNVFINGREIHPQEYVYLVSIYGSVLPGRYWLNAQMIGGFEGGPAAFDLRAAVGGGGGGGGGGYNRNTVGGGLMSDGNCSGFLHPNGSTVMTGNC